MRFSNDFNPESEPDYNVYQTGIHGVGTNQVNTPVSVTVLSNSHGLRVLSDCLLCEIVYNNLSIRNLWFLPVDTQVDTSVTFT